MNDKWELETSVLKNVVGTGEVDRFDRTGGRVARIDPIGGKVHSMSFSQDGSRLLIGTDVGLASVLELSASEAND